MFADLKLIFTSIFRFKEISGVTMRNTARCFCSGISLLYWLKSISTKPRNIIIGTIISVFISVPDWGVL